MLNLLLDGHGEYVFPTDLSQKFTIGGVTKPYPVYRVRLDKLFYNDQNDRIATWISQFKSERGDNAFETLSREEYNAVIEGFIVQSNGEAIEKTRNNIALVQQRQPGVILADGRVIDGNRRFTCLRQLAKNDEEFNWFETVILNTTIENNKKQIKMLELAIQHGEEQRVDYNHIDRLVGVYQDLIETKLLTVEEYAESTNESENEVKKKMEHAQLLIEFLEFIHMPKQYHVARDYQVYSVIVELLPILRKCSTLEMRTKVKETVFTNVMMHSVPDWKKYMRNLSAMMDTGFFMTYMKEQERISGALKEDLEEGAFSSKKELEVFISNHDDAKEDLQASLDKSVLKAKKFETRNRPSRVVSKSISMLKDVDTKIFDKLTDLEKENLQGQLDRLTTIVKGIDSKVNDGPEMANPESIAPTCVEQGSGVADRDLDKRWYIACARPDEPCVRCLNLGVPITNLSFSVILQVDDAKLGQKNEFLYRTFFLDENKIPLGETREILLTSGTETKTLFSLESKVSQMKQCYLALQSVEDEEQHLQQLIPLDVKIAFFADFDF